MGIIKIKRGYYNNGLRDKIDAMDSSDCRLVGYETIDGIEYEVFYTYEDAEKWYAENKQRLHQEFMGWLEE